MWKKPNLEDRLDEPPNQRLTRNRWFRERQNSIVPSQCLCRWALTMRDNKIGVCRRYGLSEYESLISLDMISHEFNMHIRTNIFTRDGNCKTQYWRFIVLTVVWRSYFKDKDTAAWCPRILAMTMNRQGYLRDLEDSLSWLFCRSCPISMDKNYHDTTKASTEVPKQYWRYFCLWYTINRISKSLYTLDP
jgi:hypothetical protein